MYLIAEYCRGPFYMGWHLYLRENRILKRNKDGGWGWIRQVREHPVMGFLKSIGITIRGDGTCDDDGIAAFAIRYPINGRRSGGKRRGCIEVEVDDFRKIKMANQSLDLGGGEDGGGGRKMEDGGR